jgi:hypothetical protein
VKEFYQEYLIKLLLTKPIVWKRGGLGWRCGVEGLFLSLTDGSVFFYCVVGGCGENEGAVTRKKGVVTTKKCGGDSNLTTTRNATAVRKKEPNGDRKKGISIVTSRLPPDSLTSIDLKYVKT